jgi:hypothetical protein
MPGIQDQWRQATIPTSFDSAGETQQRRAMRVNRVIRQRGESMSVKWERVAFLDSAAPCAGGKLCEKREVRIDCCLSRKIVGRCGGSKAQGTLRPRPRLEQHQSKTIDRRFLRTHHPRTGRSCGRGERRQSTIVSALVLREAAPAPPSRYENRRDHRINPISSDDGPNPQPPSCLILTSRQER